MPTGLIRRGARYSIRRRVPLDLIARYGKAEIVQALGTADPKLARKLLPLRWAELDREFDAARSLAEQEAKGEPARSAANMSNTPKRALPLSDADAPQTAGIPKASRPGGLTSLDAVVDKWAVERKVSEKGVDAHRAVARVFREGVGELALERITKRDVLAFKDKLLEAGNGHANVKVKLTRLRTLLNYAYDNDLIATRPAAGVNVIDPDADKNKRKPFDRAALAAIFSSPIYGKAERPTQGRGEAAYWLPLLALYTGARMEELGQLRPSDIREETYLDGEDAERSAWVIRITEDAEDGLKIKNAGSERLVPVHADLETLGFIRFVQAAQVARQARVFPALKPNKYGRLTAKWGEWFSLYKRETCGVTDRRMVFHSFRHTFKDNARHSGLLEGVQRQIMGHSGKGVADDYGEGYSLHQLVQGMKAYRVPGFKLPAPTSTSCPQATR
jgi:integrase